MDFFPDTTPITAENQVFQGGQFHLSAHGPVKRQLIPIIKLSEPKTFRPWERVDCYGVVIKAQHLLSTDGKRTNNTYDMIQSAGGFHSYLQYEGNVILSSIMPDKTIYGFSVEAYAEMIDSLKPDFYLTPDGETYLGEPEISSLEIDRIIGDTKFLLNSCPFSHPIGLVKGGTISQIDNHTVQLLELGLSRFVFHAGEYLCRGTSCVIGKGIAFASTIRKRVPWLGIYGIGAMKSFRSYSFADGYITQSHFVNPFYGRFRDLVQMSNDNREISRDVIMNELSHIKQDISAIELQLTLSNWGIPDISEHCIEREQYLTDPINRGLLGEEM